MTQSDEKKLEWECFCDESYYDLWCVKRIKENNFNRTFHLVNQDEANGLCEFLNSLNPCTAPPHHKTVTYDTRTHRVVPIEPVREMWASSGDAQVKHKGAFNIHHDVVTEIVWNAMLAAAPEHGEIE